MGKTYLISKLAKKYKLKVITKYSLYQKPYIHIKNNTINTLPSTNKKEIFLIDGLDLSTIKNLQNKGYVIIGYIN